MNTISFVVDNLSSHYYQAELLLHSLELNTNFKKDNILVQCLDRVEEKFLDYLSKNGYTYNIIEPYLDGKYCNKLQQLAYFKDKDIDGVILMDTDMFVLDDLDAICGEEIIAKIVDAPNPILSTLKAIYKDALLESPPISPSDWNMDNNLTFVNNFNGGFYYIPKKHINIMQKEWKKWANWLYNKPKLFEKPQQFIHVDQISFSLSVHTNNLKYKRLTANYNFPIHSNREITSYNKNENIKIIHYHREIDDFGFLNNSKIDDEQISFSIDTANKTICKKDNIIFYTDYKKSFVNNLNFSKDVLSFKNNLEELKNIEGLTLIFHAGTPKTGTTSLQSFLNLNNQELKNQGCLYSQYNLHKNPPKHQWIVSNLKNNNFEEIFKNLKAVYLESINSSSKTIFLSTEGIYNHWWDFSSEAKTVLYIIAKVFNMQLWVFFRDHISFLQSYYKQNLKNPQMKDITCYGKDLSLREMINDKWFIKHLDYLGFVYDCQFIFGEENIKVFNYGKNIIEDVCDELNVTIENKNIPRENSSLSSISIELLRVVNKYNLSASEKSIVVKNLSLNESVFKKHSSQSDYMDDIKAKFHIQKEILNKEYNLLL